MNSNLLKSEPYYKVSSILDSYKSPPAQEIRQRKVLYKADPFAKAGDLIRNRRQETFLKRDYSRRERIPKSLDTKKKLFPVIHRFSENQNYKEKRNQRIYSKREPVKYSMFEMVPNFKDALRSEDWRDKNKSVVFNYTRKDLSMYVVPQQNNCIKNQTQTIDDYEKYFNEYYDIQSKVTDIS